MTEYVYHDRQGIRCVHTRPLSWGRMDLAGLWPVVSPAGSYALIGCGHDGGRDVLGMIEGDLADCAEVMRTMARTSTAAYVDFEVELRQIG